jgi:hypothetical protein
MPTDKPLPDTDDDIIDLTDLVEEGNVGAAASGDDAPVDMSFEQELDDLFGDAAPPADKAAAPAAKPATSATPAAAPPATDDDDGLIDLAGLEVEEAPATPELADLPDAADKTAIEADVAMDDAMADLFAEIEATAKAPDEVSAPEPAADLDEPVTAAVAPEAVAEPALDDLLGELPEAPEEVGATPAPVDVAELADLPSLEETPAAEPAPSTAAGEAALPLAAVAATAAAAGSIDLAALDKLIDGAKGPLPAPEPEAEETSDRQARFDALTARIDALETAAATLSDKVEALPTAADGDALVAAVSQRLEDALSERLEAILAGQPPATDAESLKASILDEAAKQAASHHTELATEVRESLTRLEALTLSRQTRFDDFAASVETKLAELKNELPQPGEYATADGLAASMENLGETLSREIAGKLDERMAELKRELRETLSTELASSLDERLSEAMESARQAARQEVQALGEVLSGRIETLETERLDPDALAERVRNALAPSLEPIAAKADRTDLNALGASLRAEMREEIERAVPQAAATVIREEITALAKEFLE